MTRLVGNPAPEFSAQALVGSEFKSISSNDYKGRWTVLFFYPLDFTFVCPTEITAYSDAVPKFKELNCDVLACSVDSHFTHLAWTKQDRKDGGLGSVDFPILADLNKTIARDYNVLLEDAGIALRGLFIIDDKGIIQHATVNNLPVGRNVDETLRLVEAFQFTAKHGEVCPANWKKGEETMVPNPTDSKKWFKSNK